MVCDMMARIFKKNLIKGINIYIYKYASNVFLLSKVVFLI